MFAFFHLQRRPIQNYPARQDKKTKKTPQSRARSPQLDIILTSCWFCLSTCTRLKEEAKKNIYISHHQPIIQHVSITRTPRTFPLRPRRGHRCTYLHRSSPTTLRKRPRGFSSARSRGVAAKYVFRQRRQEG